MGGRREGGREDKGKRVIHTLIFVLADITFQIIGMVVG